VELMPFQEELVPFRGWWEQNKKDCHYAEMPDDVIESIAKMAFAGGYSEGYKDGFNVGSDGND
jgi:hypothetical protein